jgi:hypothetical protein
MTRGDRVAKISLGGFWVQDAEARALLIQRRLSSVTPNDQERVRTLVDSAIDLIEGRPRSVDFRWWTEWWTGSRIEMVWNRLHQAESELLAVAPPQLLDVLLEEAVAAAASLPAEDPARLRLAALVKGLTVPLSQMNA